MVSGLDNWAALGSNIPTDISIIVIDKGAGQTQSHIFKAHKIVLSLASPVFQAEFFGLAKDKSDEVMVQDTTKDAFEAMIDHVYMKKVDLKVPFHQLHEIVNLAEKYQMKSLMRKVVNHLESQPLQSEEAAMEVTAMADMFPGFDEVSRPLLLRCASFMMENVFKDIKDVANFTSRCSEEGHTSAALKLLKIYLRNIPGHLNKQ